MFCDLTAPLDRNGNNPFVLQLTDDFQPDAVLMVASILPADGVEVEGESEAEWDSRALAYACLFQTAPHLLNLARKLAAGTVVSASEARAVVEAAELGIRVDASPLE